MVSQVRACTGVFALEIFDDVAWSPWPTWMVTRGSSRPGSWTTRPRSQGRGGACPSRLQPSGSPGLGPLGGSHRGGGPDLMQPETGPHCQLWHPAVARTRLHSQQLSSARWAERSSLPWMKYRNPGVLHHFSSSFLHHRHNSWRDTPPSALAITMGPSHLNPRTSCPRYKFLTHNLKHKNMHTNISIFLSWWVVRTPPPPDQPLPPL